MLPMAVQFAIAMVASAINDRMRRRVAYLEARGIGAPGALGERDGEHPLAVHGRATPAARGRREGAEPGGASGVLPYRVPGDDSGVVPRAWG